MLRFRRLHTLQKLATGHASVHKHLPTERNLHNRDTYKQTRAAVLAEWRGLLAAKSEGGAGEMETGSHSSDSTGVRSPKFCKSVGLVTRTESRLKADSTGRDPRT